MISFNAITGEVLVATSQFAGLNLAEEVNFSFQLNYSGAVASNTIDITLKGGGDAVEYSSSSDEVSVAAVSDDITTIDLSERLETADSASVDVAIIGVEEIGGDPNTGVTAWFDLEGGGRVRFRAPEGAENPLSQQSIVEFDQDGDFDDLAPQGSAITSGSFGFQAAGFEGLDEGSLASLDLTFEVRNTELEQAPIVELNPETIFISTANFISLPESPLLRGDFVDLLGNDVVTGGTFETLRVLSFSAGDSGFSIGDVSLIRTEVDGQPAFAASPSGAFVDLVEELGQLTTTLIYSAEALSPNETRLVRAVETANIVFFAPDGESPDAETDFVRIQEDDASVVFDVLVNDFTQFQDPNGQSLEVTHINGQELSLGGFVVTDDGVIVELEDDGQLNIIADTTGARFEYLAEGESELLNFTYIVEDIQGLQDVGTVALTIEGANDRPIVNANGQKDIIVTDEVGSDGAPFTIDLFANDFDADVSDVLTVASLGGVDLVDGQATVAGPEGGVFAIASDGSLSFDPGDDFFVLNDGERAEFSIDYRAEDEAGTFDTGTVDVTVIGLDQPRTAADDDVTVDEDQGTVLSILGNDLDPDGGLDDSFISEIAGTDVSGGGVFDIALESGASLEFVAEANLLVYNPAAAANGLGQGETGFDSFTYSLTANGQVTTATVNVEIIGENDAPIPANDQAFLIGAGAIRIDVLANDIDPDGDEVRLSEINFVSRGTAEIDINGTRAPEDDVIVFTPDNDDLGVASIGYTVTDQFGATRTAFVTVTIVPGNSIFGDDDANTIAGTPEDDTIFALDGNDSIEAFGGDDLILAGEGDDAVSAGEGDDRVDLSILFPLAPRSAA